MSNKWFWPLLAAWCLVLIPLPGIAQKKFEAGRAGFSVQCNQLILGYSEQAVFALPGEALHLRVVDANWRKKYYFESEVGQVQWQGEREWIWTVPEAVGDYSGRLYQLDGEDSVFIYCFVMLPFSALQNGEINGYSIGEYPDGADDLHGDYPPPNGFIEVTEENIDRKVMPHFTLRQFVCHQTGDFPKYLVLDERLLIKLEVILARVNLEGFSCRTLSVSSGYRTPYYNRKLGNVQHSLHMWGRAADVFVDGNYDNRMDDLNRDGKFNLKDVRRLMDIVERLENEPRHQDKVGGLGLYDRTENHGPFVHIDVREERARWER